MDTSDNSLTDAAVSKPYRATTRPIYLLCLFVVAALLLSSGARASETKAEPFVGYTKYVRYHTHYDVNANGTHVETHEWALKVLSEQGISSANQSSISYSDRLQHAEILSAYTLKKDGRKIDVPPSNFQEDSSKGKGDASPMFSDIKTKTVAFPDVAVGDTVVMSYKLTQTEATFPGNFSIMETFSKFEAYDDVEISLSAPASLDMRVYNRGVEGGEVPSKDNRHNWTWSYRNKEIALPEAASVSPLDYGPLIVATTFKDYGAVAAAYNSRAAAKAVPTDRIKKLANEVTLNLHTPREQAKALYQWVSANIQFAGNCVGVGSVVPHDADLVLANRMGDCKDHTTLLQALLAVKGIASTPVLINSGDAYTLPEVPAVDIFNHVISYIPSLDLYADSTARYTSFGLLPFDDSGKPVIHTANFSGIRYTPKSSYKDYSSRTSTVLTIHPDGSADGETKVEVTGHLADSSRASMTYVQPNMEDMLIRRALAGSGYTGTGTLIKNDPKVLGPTYSYGGRYHLNDAMNLPGPGAAYIRSPFAATIARFVGAANEPDRTVNYQCFGGDSKEEYTINLPKGIEVLATPKDVQLKGKNETYQASYKVKGNTLTAVRELDDHTPGNVCTPKDAAEFKKFAAPVQRDLRAQLVYR